jgi:type IV secretory pathway VirJ component
MSTLRFLAGILAGSFALGAFALDGGRYGDVKVVVPKAEPVAYVIFFSDRTGWDSDDDAALSAIAKGGAVAIGVDLQRYYAKVGEGKRQACEDLVGDAEGLARQHQHELHLATYEFPVLAGVGEGAALARRIWEQAPDHTLSGFAGVDPSAHLHIPRALCRARTSKPSGFHEIDDAHGHPVTTALPARMMALLHRHLVGSSADGVAALPLEELPVASKAAVLAVVLSGDGGWRDLDRAIAENLQRHGVPVVGWDSLRYFWHLRTSQETARDLANVLRVYGERWHADRFALIGYSFGADVLPATYLQLPDDLRQRVTLVTLLALSPKADWEISVSGWLGSPPTDAAVSITGELAQVPPRIVQCIYGVEEADTICPSLDGTGVELIKTSGGHHFDHDYDALAQRILARLAVGQDLEAVTAPRQ